MRGNPENLRHAAARKSAAAAARAEDGLRELLRSGQPITFRALARTGGVSVNFLYRHHELRARVEQLRAQQQGQSPAATLERGGPDEPSSVIRTLTAQLSDLKARYRNDTAALRQALEVAQGENLELRRRLGPHHAPG